MGLPQARKNHLAVVAVPLNPQRRVFLDQPRQARAELVDVGLGARLDGRGENRRRHLGRRNQQLRAGRAQRVESGRVRELGHHAEIARRHLRCDLHLFALRVRKARKALVVARPRVLQMRIAAHRARRHAQVREPPHKLVRSGLEDERRRVCARVRLETLIERRRFERTREGRGDQPQNRRNADVRRSAGRQHRRERARQQRRLEPRRQILLRQLLVFEIGQHQLFVGLDDPLDQRVAARRRGRRRIRRGLRGARPVALVRPPAEHLDGAAELRLRADRQQERLALGAEHALHASQRVVPTRVLAIQPSDHHRAGNAPPSRHPPGRLGADLHARGSVDHHDRGVRHGHGGNDLADEIGVAGRVQQVEPQVAVSQRDQRSADRHPAVPLLGVKVGDGVAVLNAPDPGNRPGRERERLNQRRLARALVPHDGDIADVLSGSGHISLRAHAPPNTGERAPKPNSRRSAAMLTDGAAGVAARPASRPPRPMPAPSLGRPRSCACASLRTLVALPSLDRRTPRRTPCLSAADSISGPSP